MYESRHFLFTLYPVTVYSEIGQLQTVATSVVCSATPAINVFYVTVQKYEVATTCEAATGMKLRPKVRRNQLLL